MSTPYSVENRSFTDNAHHVAMSKIYPEFFNVGYEDIQEVTPPELEYLDMNLGIDKILKTRIGNHKHFFTYTIQERFREPQFVEYQDITITLENTLTNQPSEIYKICAQLFVYGYFDNQDFIDWIIVDMFSLREKILRNRIGYKMGENPRSMQTFMTISFDELLKANLVLGRKSTNLF